MADRSKYSDEPADKAKFTQRIDRVYTLLAGAYDLAVKALPVWKGWIERALPHVSGPRVLEVSFGTGYLLTRYADRFEVKGIDYNAKMVATARRNLKRAGLSAELQRGNVESLPYEDGSFDCVVNTMAFSGYPDGARAMSEMGRVLKAGGRLVIIDVNYPADGNWLGSRLIDLWKLTGDIVRDMPALFRDFGFDATEEEIGGFGSVHLYVATKRDG